MGRHNSPEKKILPHPRPLHPENENAMALNRRNLPKQRHPEAVDQVTVSVNGEDKISMGRHCLIMLHPEGEKDFSHLGNF